MAHRLNREERREKKQRVNPGVLKPGFDPGAVPVKHGHPSREEDPAESPVHDVEKAISGVRERKRVPKGGLEIDEEGAYEKPPSDVET